MAVADNDGAAPQPAGKRAIVYPTVTIGQPAAEPVPTAAKSDLGVRVGSAAVMLAVTGIAVFLGGWWWACFVAAVAVGVMIEWAGLVFEFGRGPFRRGLWLAGGLVYIGVASGMIVQLRAEQGRGFMLLPMILLGVIATDVGAYFTGRTLGGPKIAPSISPSKTWSGLAGGMALSAGAQIALVTAVPPGLATDTALGAAAFGAIVAVVAQAGDFFESWMKRRAGLKDSGRLIPGHGGLFDRLDGLLAVMFVLGLLSLPLYVYLAS